MTELFVVLKDGSGLLSRLPVRFKGFKMSILHLVITGMSFSMSRIEVQQYSDECGYKDGWDVIHQDYGALATYIPEDQITTIEISRREANN